MKRLLWAVCLCLVVTPAFADGVWDPEDLQQMMKDRYKELEQEKREKAKHQRHWTPAEIEAMRQKYTVPPGPYYTMSEESSAKIIHRTALDVIQHYGINTMISVIFVIRTLPGDWFACGAKHENSLITGMHVKSSGFVKSSDRWILYSDEVPDDFFEAFIQKACLSAIGAIE